MSAAREAIVKAAFEKLDVNGDKGITVDELAQRFNAKAHPEVMSGSKSEEQVFREMMMAWDANLDGKVSWAEFCEFYACVSASCQSDAIFSEAMTMLFGL